MSNEPAGTDSKPIEADAEATATTDDVPLGPQAAAELSQEITLLTRALFAQLLPATAANAISGIPEPGSRPHTTPASGTQPELVQSATPEPSAPLPPAVPVVEMPPTPIAIAAPAAPLPPATPPEAPSAQPAPTALAPMGGIPVPSLPVDSEDAQPTDEPPAEAPRLNRRRSMAVLEEIAFLDE